MLSTSNPVFPIHHRPAEEEFLRLKKERKICSEGLFLDDSIARRIEQYGKIRDIQHTVKRIGAESALWWPCVQLEASLWENVKDWLRRKGYSREWIFNRDGKFGLEGFDYKCALPAAYDEIIITFDHEEKLDKPVPVRVGNKCTLVEPFTDGKAVIDFKYDFIFREPFGDYNNYIVRNDGLYGIIDSTGEEKVPCVMDEIYLRTNPDGCLYLQKDGKWGLCNDRSFAPPVFDEIISESDEYTRARIGKKEGWIDMYGELTEDKDKADFGEWDEEGK